MNHWLCNGAVGIILLASAPLAAQEVEDAPSLVPTFAQTCLMPGVAQEDRRTQIEGDDRWSQSPTVTVDIAKIGVSRSIGTKPRFDKFAGATEWNGTIDGLNAKALLIDFEEGERFNYACVIMVEGLSNAMPFSDALKDAFEAFGVGRKSVDLVHYYEFAGTLKPGEHPVEERHRIHGEIFTRSQAGRISDTTHIYVAY